ncbi:MAG TPA: hypothetical protein V6D19_24380 [Stenomitos sp.]
MLYMIAATATAESTNTFAGLLLPLVLVVGFAAATILGSIAWYNSKRPLGWEDKEKPDIVPEVKESDTPGLGTP